ncbi:OsmC family protein [Facklamia sp. 7083-14-GEN3]|uniref:OsmC family protein n=1 Tax=Facklamia sp. 7083-14-GEN3 TaxID=2973478 RepID=UPI00215C87F8|nr:OsmC family protein [Facklamia sp. 7083-14-GEN3]MCR8969890.1 OsmC family protein [Facklamia sp. 7083-14-GEN3]
MMERKTLYQTKVVNRDGIQGKTFVEEPEAYEFKVASPLVQEEGTNPEQLLGMAIATCLNATIEAEELRRGLDHQAQVSVWVDLQEDNIGYQFIVSVQISIPHVSTELKESIVKVALERCPMHKLMKANATYKVIIN